MENNSTFLLVTPYPRAAARFIDSQRTAGDCRDSPWTVASGETCSNSVVAVSARGGVGTGTTRRTRMFGLDRMRENAWVGAPSVWTAREWRWLVKAIEFSTGRTSTPHALRPIARTQEDEQVIFTGPPFGEQDIDVQAARTPERLIEELTNAGANVPHSTIFSIEITRFDAGQKQALLPALWRYILAHRTSNDMDDLVATGSAIRKYVSMLPTDRMGELAQLLDAGYNCPLPLELELEVAKMIYRNFEARPPAAIHSESLLATRLWDMAQIYINPRILTRDKNAAVASLSIEALVAMRSRHAMDAWNAAVNSPYRSFGEMVSDNLAILRQRWLERGADGADAVRWLDGVRANLMVAS